MICLSFFIARIAISSLNWKKNWTSKVFSVEHRNQLILNRRFFFFCWISCLCVVKQKECFIKKKINCTGVYSFYEEQLDAYTCRIKLVVSLPFIPSIIQSNLLQANDKEIKWSLIKILLRKLIWNAHYYQITPKNCCIIKSYASHAHCTELNPFCTAVQMRTLVDNNNLNRNLQMLHCCYFISPNTYPLELVLKSQRYRTNANPCHWLNMPA